MVSVLRFAPATNSIPSEIGVVTIVALVILILTGIFWLK